MLLVWLYTEAKYENAGGVPEISSNCSKATVKRKRMIPEVYPGFFQTSKKDSFSEIVKS